MKKTKLASAISLGSAVAVVGIAEAAPPISINASTLNGVVNGVTSADNVFLNPGATDASLTITNSSIIMDEAFDVAGNDPNKPIRESVVSFGGIGTTGNLNLTIADSHIQSTTAAGVPDGDGVFVRTDGQGTHAEVNISNTTVNVDKSDSAGAVNTNFHGILLENFGGSLNATLNNVDTTLTLGTSAANNGGGVSHSAYSGGTLTIDKNSTITTSGNARAGIYIQQAANNVIQPNGPLAYDSNYNFTLNNEANIDTSNASIINGIYQLIQQGSTTINNAGNISSSGEAIKVNYGKDSPINVTVNNSGALTTTSGNGIEISGATGSNKDANINVQNTGNIKADGYAIHISNSGNGTATVDNSGALDGRTGLYVETDNTTINNTGAINAKVDAIWAIGGTGSTVLNNSGEINSELHGLHAQTRDGQYVTLNNTGKVTMTDPTRNSVALLSQNFGKTGNTNLSNSGEVSAATALEAYNSGSGAINVENSGKITATKTGIHAKHSGTGDLNINTKGNIDATATGANATNLEVAGILAEAKQGKANVSVGAGTISATGDNAYGIYLSDYNLGNTSAFALNLEKGAIVDGTQAFSAVGIAHSGDATFNIANGAQIKGGAKGAALDLQAQGANSVYTLNNAGDISSSVDNVLSTLGAAKTSTLNINNTGTITGYLANEAGVKINFTNDSGNSLNLRKFNQDSKVKGVSVSDFGGGEFTNTANGVVRLKAVNNAAGVSGANAITGSGIGNINSAGINHARLQNVAKFTNQGIISMTENQKAGDALAISNNGTGEFIGSNGILQSDIVIDGKAADGSFRGIADVLVLDNATQGQTRTALNVVKEAGLTSGLTEGEGIKIVDVKGTSAKNAFVLDKNVASGVYEYVLGRGIHSETQSFFLRNNERDANGNITRVFYSPVVGAYLGGQQAAANMFNNMSLLDRRADAINPDRTLWIRTNYGNTRAELFGGSQDLETKSTTLQMGLDVAKNAYGVAGVFAGYGNASSEVTSKVTNSKSKADIRGYQVGVYASFLPEGDQMGPYVDSWAYYARYDNKLKGLNNEESKFDANGYGASIEAGYTLPVYGMSNGKNVIIEPHAQVTYSKVDNDNFTDVNGSTFANNESKGVSTRLGARVYTQAPNSAEGLNPFLEANWLHNGMDNAVDVNGTKASTKIGENVGEVKMGAQGKINENLSVWSHVGGQFGEEGYKNYNFQIGFGMRW